jgi:CRP/FNR family transcriptional regulator, transcriptional activator FtrB
LALIDASAACVAAVATVGVSPPNARDALLGTPWLASVPARTLGRLAEHSVLHRVPSGSRLFEQAEIPAFAEILVGGSVELLGVRGEEETRIGLVQPVDLLLPAAVLTRRPYLLRARVLEEAHILMIQAEEFRVAVSEDHALCIAVLACQAAQFRRQVKQAKNMRLRSAEERVGCYLLRLLEAGPPGPSVRLPLGKRSIASELGMTRETFSRTLASIARYGLRVDGDAVRIEDLAAARARFSLDPLIDGPEPIRPLAAKEGDG